MKTIRNKYIASLYPAAFAALAAFFFLFTASFTFKENTSYRGGWTTIQTPTSNDLLSCSFPDSMNGWAVGAQGTVIRTTDGGNNWVLQNDGLNYSFLSVSFVNNRKGWVIGNSLISSNPVLLSTTNSGVNWSYYYYPDTLKVFKSVKFLDTLNGFIGLHNGEILRTTDGGINWSKIQNDTTLAAFLPVNRFTFYSKRRGVTAGGMMDIGGVLKRTTSNGSGWTSSFVAGEPLADIRFVDSLNLVGTGGDAEFGSYLYKSSNFGETGNITYLPYFGMAYTLAPRTRTEYWISMGFVRKFMVTADSGRTFFESPTPNNSAIWDMDFRDTLSGWCVGTEGLFAKYNFYTVGIRETGISGVSNEYSLYQNYPNPFNPISKIKYKVSKTSHIKINVFDITGKEVKMLVDEQQIGGEYEVTFDGTDLPSGVYYYRMQAGDYTETRKMVLVK